MILRQITLAALIFAASSSAFARIHRFKEGGGDQSMLFKCIDKNKALTIIGLDNTPSEVQVLVFWQGQLLHQDSGHISEDGTTFVGQSFILDLAILNCTRGSD